MFFLNFQCFFIIYVILMYFLKKYMQTKNIATPKIMNRIHFWVSNKVLTSRLALFFIVFFLFKKKLCHFLFPIIVIVIIITYLMIWQMRWANDPVDAWTEVIKKSCTLQVNLNERILHDWKPFSEGLKP